MERQKQIIQFQYEINVIQTVLNNELKQIQQTIIDYEEKKEKYSNSNKQTLSFMKNNEHEMKQMASELEQNENAEEMIQMILETKESIENEIATMKTKFNELYVNCNKQTVSIKERNNEIIDEMINIQKEMMIEEIKGKKGKKRNEIEEKYEKNINELKWTKTKIISCESENYDSSSEWEYQRASEQQNNEVINLLVVTQDSTKIYFKTKRTKPLKKLMEEFCKIQGLTLCAVRFLSDGVRLTPDKTPNDLRMKDGDVIYAMMNQCGAKPVILLYDNEKKENEEVSIKLTLNDGMNIGATYPNPTLSIGKQYEWKGTYSSNGNEDACQITINEKKYDYIFWEGPCIKEDQFNGEIIGIQSDKFEEELDLLLEKLGLNERERNDFIVYWLTKLSGRTGHKITICNEKYDNEISKLTISNYSQMLRVMLKFEEISSEEVNELKGIDSIQKKERPTGKYVVEWGAILA